VSRLRADTLTDRTGTSAPDLTHGATSTTGTFSGDLGGGDVTLSGDASVDGTLTYQDADNINSTGIITAQQGIQVSANGLDVTGISTFNSPITVAGITTINDSGLHVTGVVTATSFVGDGSQLSGTNRTVSLVASGTLSNGQTVIVTSDGKAKAVGEEASDTPSVGTAVVFEEGITEEQGITFDSNSNKVVVAYRDRSNSDHGTAVVGTVSGNTISFGTPVVFASANTQYCRPVFDSSNNKVVIVFSDNANSSYGTAIVGTVSGDTISFGTEVVFESAAISSQVTATFDSSNNKVVIAYHASGFKAIVGTVSGTSISFGSSVNIATTGTYCDSTFDTSNNKVVLAYSQNTTGYGAAIVGTVSGTSISFGSETVFESYASGHFGIAFDSSNNKVVIAYQDEEDNYGKAIVATVSGSSISFGTAVAFESANTDQIKATYDSAAGKVVIVYQDIANSNYGTAISGTVSGTSISFGTAVVFLEGNVAYPVVTYDSNANRSVIAYENDSNSSKGTGIVYSNMGTNLTSENFIGFSDAAYSDGNTATVQVVTALDDAQSGLTTGSKHYVQSDGTLSTTAGSPSVLAGTAISDTEIIVKQ
jgi:hypothetical protein